MARSYTNPWDANKSWQAHHNAMTSETPATHHVARDENTSCFGMRSGESICPLVGPTALTSPFGLASPNLRPGSPVPQR
jgi:hypothetical protein